MFTGIIEEVGTVHNILHHGAAAVLEVNAKQVLSGTRIGDSIAVNGVCLTVTHMTDNRFKVDLAPESLKRTNFGLMRPGSPLNLERSVQLGGRIGGHFVQGHVDGAGTVRERRAQGSTAIISFSTQPDLMRYIVVKGFIAVDGMSLTVVNKMAEGFSVSFIPHTLANSIAGSYQTGIKVNLEVDILGKYVESLINKKEPGITMGFLAEHGFFD
ncbi:MAG: riboflavin synthase [Anaerolineales bacterium]|nr:riboflavin synthase [Anaerolineales bacterium]